MLSLQANATRKIPRKHLNDIVDTVENLDVKQQIVPIKSNQNKGSKGKNEHKKKQSTNGNHKGKGHKDMSKIKCFNLVQKHAIMLIVLKKVSRTSKLRICWIWTMLVYVRSVQ